MNTTQKKNSLLKKMEKAKEKLVLIGAKFRENQKKSRVFKHKIIQNQENNKIESIRQSM
jgi:hypothetical protein